MKESGEKRAVTAYITKYAISKGVMVVSAEVSAESEAGDGGVYVASQPGGGRHYGPRDWAADEEGAREQVRRKARAALTTLDKRRKVLEALLVKVERGELPMAGDGGE